MTLFDAYPYSFYPIPTLTAFLVVVICLVVVLCLIMVSLARKASEKQNKKQLVLLAINFLMLGLGLALVAVPTSLALLRAATGNTTNIIYGIPIGGTNQIYWSNIAYALIVVSSICILLFDKELFGHRSLFGRFQYIMFTVYFAGAVIFGIWSIYIGIVEFPTTLESLPTVPGILFILLNIFPWLVLYIYARKDLRSIQKEKSLYVLGFRLIKDSGIIMTVSYVLYLIEGLIVDPNVYSVFDVIIIAFYIGAAILLYIGFRMPNWFKNRYMARGYTTD
ncbi:MAG TPA: hypothetical protein VKK79_07100 [Candidatus Lokiarchaeia archaeon]|nr:hypothetical protein [Candidatus Lokiarchaeia archaeon]